MYVIRQYEGPVSGRRNPVKKREPDKEAKVIGSFVGGGAGAAVGAALGGPIGAAIGSGRRAVDTRGSR